MYIQNAFIFYLGALDGGEEMYKSINNAFIPLIETFPNEFGGLFAHVIFCAPNPSGEGCTPIPVIIVSTNL
jgi:hypothetical protein